MNASCRKRCILEGLCITIAGVAGFFSGQGPDKPDPPVAQPGSAAIHAPKVVMGDTHSAGMRIAGNRFIEAAEVRRQARTDLSALFNSLTHDRRTPDILGTAVRVGLSRDLSSTLAFLRGLSIEERSRYDIHTMELINKAAPDAFCELFKPVLSISPALRNRTLVAAASSHPESCLQLLADAHLQPSDSLLSEIVDSINPTEFSEARARGFLDKLGKIPNLRIKSLLTSGLEMHPQTANSALQELLAEFTDADDSRSD